MPGRRAPCQPHVRTTAARREPTHRAGSRSQSRRAARARGRVRWTVILRANASRTSVKHAESDSAEEKMLPTLRMTRVKLRGGRRRGAAVAA